uniref:Uncharacterized protein n=1 Tax=Trichogramma kaykai TaxID=54128 RepID=A0ABD2XMT5_9HYME
MYQPYPYQLGDFSPTRQLALPSGFVNQARLFLRRGKGSDSTLFEIFKIYHDDDLAEIIPEMIDEPFRAMPIDTREKERRLNKLLPMALRNEKKKTAELLLRRGADPNLADENGSTPLHIICERTEYDNSLMELFFEINDEKNQLVQIDVRDRCGKTPLYLTQEGGNIKAFELLLRRGANPNMTFDKGFTLLHKICDEFFSNITIWGDKIKILEMLFKIDDQRHSRVQVDARDESGNTPLHYALKRGIEEVTQLLLRNGANPNSANDNRETPLHVICKGIVHFRYYDMADIFFKTCDENHLQVEVDAVDNLGRTPLQLAVANLLPDAVDVLLDRGADVSRFAFPTDSYYGVGFDPQEKYLFGMKLTMASGAMAVLNSLEDRGYELDQSVAVKVMKFFVKHGLFEKSPAIQKWLIGEESAKFLKKKMIKPDLSLYDLVQLRPVEAAKQLTYRDYIKFGRENQFCLLPGEELSTNCASHLGEKISRGFFRAWAIKSFMELTKCRLLLECSEMIIDRSGTNKDLLNICLAAVDQSSSTSENT